MRIIYFYVKSTLKKQIVKPYHILERNTIYLQYTHRVKKETTLLPDYFLSL